MANKQDLIAKVAEATELTKKDSAAAVDAVFAAVSGTPTCSARAGLANRAEPIIKEQAPIDSLRIL